MSMSIIPVSEVFAAQVAAEAKKLNEMILSAGHVRDYCLFYVPATDNPEAVRKLIPAAKAAGWHLHCRSLLVILAHPDARAEFAQQVAQDMESQEEL